MSRRHQRGRLVDGILPFDKPAGITSNRALQQVKHLYEARKAGHTGSLDELATGLLPLCFGEATKVSAYLLDADKHYRARCRLGIKTTTADALGETISERPLPELNSERIEAALKAFTGTIEQIPPMHSALKHQGKRLYELARAGVEVERPPRPVTIHALSLIDRGPDWLDIDVRCSKGTYIRTLAEDIGEQLGCGAHISALRRLGAGPFTAADMVTLEQLHEALESGGQIAIEGLLRPLDSALDDSPAVTLDAASSHYLSQGQAVRAPNAPTRGWLRVYDAAGCFLGIGEVLEDGRIAPKRLLRSD